MSNIENQEIIEEVMVIPQLTISEQGTPLTSSLDIANVFGKEHFHVLRDIENLLKELPEDFNQSNFGLSSYINQQNKEQPMYNLTRDAFTLLAMGFTGKKALAFKLKYIEAFNAMENIIKNTNSNFEQSQKYIELEPDKDILPRNFTSKLSEKGLKAIVGYMHFIAFLNNTTYETIENYCLKTLGISSINECNGYMGNTLMSILSFYQTNMFFFAPQESCLDLDSYKNAFYGLIDYWKLYKTNRSQHYIELYICTKADIQSLEQIQTKEQYLKGIFILYKGILKDSTHEK